jgi:plasmid stabilization system protein ParE
MKNKLIISDEAAFDVEEAFLWYAEIEFNLALRFEKELYRTIDHLLLYPDSFQKRYKGVRISFLKKFPYGVHYLFQEDSIIVVVGVFHTSRSPENWFDRIK